MLVFCFVHVEQNQGEGQLLAGDILQLEHLLPKSAVVRRLQLGQRVRLTFEEAATLLAQLHTLNAELLDEPYHRSAMHAELVVSRKELIEGFRYFLASELVTLGSA